LRTIANNGDFFRLDNGKIAVFIIINVHVGLLGTANR
jgi:hypothetical protein